MQDDPIKFSIPTVLTSINPTGQFLLVPLTGNDTRAYRSSECESHFHSETYFRSDIHIDNDGGGTQYKYHNLL